MRPYTRFDYSSISTEQQKFYVRYVRLTLNCLLTLLWIICPFVALFYIFSCLYFVKLSRKEFIYYVFLAAAYPALINITKHPVSDLLAYSICYVRYSNAPISELFHYVNTDYLYYFIDIVIGKLTAANVAAYVGFWSIFTYFLVMWTQMKCYEWLPGNKDNRRYLILVMSYTLFAGLLFGLSAHLMREYPAGALLILAVCCWAFGKKYHILLYLGAVMIHFSLLLFAPVFLLWRGFRARSLLVIPVLMLAALVVGSTNMLESIPALMGKESSIGFISDISAKAFLYVSRNDGEVSLLAWMRLGLFELFACYLLFRYGKNNEPLQKFSFAMLYLLTMLVLFRNTDLLLLRYFYYTDFFNVVLLVFAIYYEINHPYFKIALLLVALISPFKFIYDIHHLYMEYIDNSYYIIGYGLFDFFQAVPAT